MTLLLRNTVLRAVEDKIESSLTNTTRKDYTKIVLAGMKAAMEKGGQGILADLAKSKNPLEDCAKGAVNLCLLMRKKSRGTMPVKAMVPAAMTLMLHALDFVDKAGIMPIGNPEIVKATHIFATFIFSRIGVSKEMLGNAATKLDKLASDPVNLTRMEQFSTRHVLGEGGVNG
tara:strand:- start:184 stop:702 length:519 start_codon:yes stop_codon:yes gene_type:complete